MQDIYLYYIFTNPFHNNISTTEIENPLQLCVKKLKRDSIQSAEYIEHTTNVNASVWNKRLVDLFHCSVVYIVLEETLPYVSY